MTAITLESDSSHSPPLLDKSNERSSKKSPKKAKNLPERGNSLREFSQGLANNSPVLWAGDPAAELESSGQKNRNSSATKISAFRLGFLVGLTIVSVRL